MNDSLRDSGRCDYCLQQLRKVETKHHINHGRRVDVKIEYCDTCNLKYQTRYKEHHGYDWRNHGRKVIA